MSHLIGTITQNILLMGLLASIHANAEQAVAPAPQQGTPVRSAQSSPSASSVEWILGDLEWLLVAGVGSGVAIYAVAQWRRRRRAIDSLAQARAMTPEVRKPSGLRDMYMLNADERDSSYWTPLEETTTVTVEEMTNVLEEAEVFLLLGRMDMAIGVLRHYIESNEKAPAKVWAALLDVLHSQGLRREFEKLALAMKARFNVAPPTWESQNERSSSFCALEHFPSLLKQISRKWVNTRECLIYLNSLIPDDRKGERSGFQYEAFLELLLLIDVLEYKVEQ
jgi:hypothetical protein